MLPALSDSIYFFISNPARNKMFRQPNKESRA